MASIINSFASLASALSKLSDLVNVEILDQDLNVISNPVWLVCRTLINVQNVIEL